VTGPRAKIVCIDGPPTSTPWRIVNSFGRPTPGRKRGVVALTPSFALSKTWEDINRNQEHRRGANLGARLWRGFSLSGGAACAFWLAASIP
jgi:hypothetical protein